MRLLLASTRASVIFHSLSGLICTQLASYFITVLCDQQVFGKSSRLFMQKKVIALALRPARHGFTPGHTGN